MSKSNKWILATIIFVFVLIGTAMIIPNLPFLGKKSTRLAGFLGTSMTVFKSSERAKTLLGEPLRIEPQEPDFNSLKADGSAQLTFPVAGSRHKGLVHVEAKETAGFWHVDHLDLQLEGQTGWTNILQGDVSPPAATAIGGK